ncbi:MAG: electron transfer flavoprotein subunit beta/FixA family protein [Gammaproteobacteria bacterium]|nr:electron transfer flavoprotein subunit beta/FixA family protein [Gammaproteobacteria bacterium]
MKILVPIKRVIDYRVKVRIKPDNSDVDLSNVKMAMNPFDEIALEEAIRLKEKNIATEVVAVTIGTAESQETLRTALALGADRAILQELEPLKSGVKAYPLQIAKILKYVISQEQPQLVIMGKQAIDDDNNQTGQMLAGLLGWPQATFASKIMIEDSKLLVTREIDGGLQIITLTYPAVVTTDLRLNEPRYASLPNIMKAKSKPLTVNKVADLPDVNFTNLPEVLEVRAPKVREPGVKVASVDELLDKLRTIEKLI